MQSLRNILICCALVFVGVSVATAQKPKGEKQVESGKSYTRVIGQSGRILFGRKGKNETDAIVIDFDGMTELDAAGELVGKGKKGHSFKSFASRNFTFSELRDTRFNNLKCKVFDFHASLPGPDATLNVTTYIFMEAGEVEIGETETEQMQVGSLKWSIEIKNWTFCGMRSEICRKKANATGKGEPAKNETGMYLEFDISVRSRIKPKLKRSNESKTTTKDKKRLKTATYELGDNTIMSLSNQTKVDGKWVEMPEGYPKLTQRGGKNIFTFRFRKFRDELFYDPSLTNTEGTDGTDPTGGTNGTDPTGGTDPPHDSGGVTIPSPSASFLALPSLFVEQSLQSIFLCFIAKF